MPKLLTRIVALLVVPCLIADPVTAFALTPNPLCPLRERGASTYFEDQALAAVPEFLKHLLSNSFQGFRTLDDALPANVVHGQAWLWEFQPGEGREPSRSAREFLVKLFAIFKQGHGSGRNDTEPPKSAAGSGEDKSTLHSLAQTLTQIGESELNVKSLIEDIESLSERVPIDELASALQSFVQKMGDAGVTPDVEKQFGGHLFSDILRADCVFYYDNISFYVRSGALEIAGRLEAAAPGLAQFYRTLAPIKQKVPHNLEIRRIAKAIHAYPGDLQELANRLVLLSRALDIAGSPRLVEALICSLLSSPNALTIALRITQSAYTIGRFYDTLKTLGMSENFICPFLVATAARSDIEESFKRLTDILELLNTQREKLDHIRDRIRFDAQANRDHRPFDKSIFRVRGWGFSGSCFLVGKIERTYIFITNTHVIHRDEPVVVETFAGRQVGVADVVLRHALDIPVAGDIAMLAMPMDDAAISDLNPLEFDAALGDGTLATLYSGSNNNVASGILFTVDDLIMLLGAPTVQGDSGSPYIVWTGSKYVVAGVIAQKGGLGFRLTPRLVNQMLAAVNGHIDSRYKFIHRSPIYVAAIKIFLESVSKPPAAPTTLPVAKIQIDSEISALDSKIRTLLEHSNLAKGYVIGMRERTEIDWLADGRLHISLSRSAVEKSRASLDGTTIDPAVDELRTIVDRLSKIPMWPDTPPHHAAESLDEASRIALIHMVEIRQKCALSHDWTPIKAAISEVVSANPELHSIVINEVFNLYRKAYGDNSAHWSEEDWTRMTYRIVSDLNHHVYIEKGQFLHIGSDGNLTIVPIRTYRIVPHHESVVYLLDIDDPGSNVITPDSHAFEEGDDLVFDSVRMDTHNRAAHRELIRRFGMQPVFGEMVSMTEEKYVQISRFTSISEEWRHLEDFSRQIDGLLADAIPDDNALVDIVMDVAHAIHPMVRSVATRIQEAARSGAIKNSDNVRFIAMEAHARTQSLYEAPSPEYQQEILSTIAADAIGDEDPPIHKLAAEIVLQELAHSRIQSSSQKPANQIDAMDAFRQICLVDPQTLWEALRNEPKAAALPAATVSFNAKRQWDVAAFENILRLHGNTEAEITKAIKLITEVPPESALLFEPAAGKAQAAYEIARLDPHCRVVVCDVFDGTYSGTTQMWKDGELLGQNEPLDNFVILKSPATLLDLLPDKSLDDFLLINPTLTLERGLGQFFQKDRIQRKMKPGGRVIFRPHASSDFWTRGEDIDGSFPDNIVFRTYSSVIRGVDLVRYSEHSEGQGAVLLWQSPLAAPKNRMGMVEFWNHPHLDWMPYGLKVFLSGILEPLWYQILLPLVNPSMMDPERRKAKFLNDHGPHQTAEQIGIRENLFVADRMASWISLVSLAAGSAIATPHSWLGWVSQIVMVVFIWSSPHLTWNVSEMFQPDPIYGFTGKPNAPPSAAAPKDLLGQFLAGTDANRSLDTYDALQTGDVVSLVELPDSGGERQTFIKELVELHRIHNGRIHQNLLPLAHRWRVNLAVVIAQAHNKAESQFLPIGQFSETLGDVQNPEAMAAESKVRTLSRLQFAKGDSFIVKLPAQQRKKGFNPTLLIYEKIRIKADQLAEALPGLRHLMLKNLPKWLLGTVISYGFGSYQIAYTVPVHANERFFQGHVMPVNLTAANNLIQHGHLKRASSSPAPKETGRNLTKTSS